MQGHPCQVGGLLCLYVLQVVYYLRMRVHVCLSIPATQGLLLLYETWQETKTIVLVPRGPRSSASSGGGENLALGFESRPSFFCFCKGSPSTGSCKYLAPLLPLFFGGNFLCPQVISPRGTHDLHIGHHLINQQIGSRQTERGEWTWSQYSVSAA